MTANAPGSDSSRDDRFLVIGSNSFSGASFVARLLEEGHEVVGISRSPEPHDCLLPYKWGPHERFRFVRADLNEDLDRIAEVLHEWRPAYVANFAAQGMVPQSWGAPEQWFQTNVQAMVALHERLRKCEFLRGFLQVSTPEVYGSTSQSIREDAGYNPSTPYAASKAACDLSLQTFVKGYGFPAVFTRSANVCGPGQPLYRIVPRTVASILTGRKLRLEGGGVARRSFVHVRDVSEGQLLALQRGRPGDVFHLGTEEIVTIRELVEAICRELEVRFEDHVEIVEGRRGEDGAYLLDCTKARTELGWRPRHDLRDVIRDTIGWAKSNLEVLRGLGWDYVHKK